MWLTDPLEWQYIYTLAKSLLPGLSFHRDEEAAELASRLGGLPIGKLREFDWTRPVIYMPPFKRIAEGTVVVAVEGHTAKKLAGLGVRPHVVVTDLDFEPDYIDIGLIAVVHAHGDNIDRLAEYARGPRIYTVQTPPRPNTYNVGGFTDGDRAIYLAIAMGAREIIVSGFYPEEPIKRNDEVKRRKLALAKALIKRLSSRALFNMI